MSIKKAQKYGERVEKITSNGVTLKWSRNRTLTEKSKIKTGKLMNIMRELELYKSTPLSTYNTERLTLDIKKKINQCRGTRNIVLFIPCILLPC